MQKFIAVGNLGNDPEVRYLPNGSTVASFSVATSRRWKDKETGEKKEKTEWHNCRAYGKLAEIIGEYLKKGSKVWIDGYLETEKWEKEGHKFQSTKIVVEEMKMLDSKDKSDDTTTHPQQVYTPAPPVQQKRPDNAQLGSDGKTWWIPNPASPSGWEIWQ